MINIINIFKTYGGLGVLSVWLFFTNSRVDKLERQLIDCNDSKLQIFRELTIPKVSTSNTTKLPLLAIIPEKITFKNQEDEINTEI